MLNEIEASQLSDIEFKTMIIRKLNELSENYQKLQGNCINMKKDVLKTHILKSFSFLLQLSWISLSASQQILGPPKP